MIVIALHAESGSALHLQIATQPMVGRSSLGGTCSGLESFTYLQQPAPRADLGKAALPWPCRSASTTLGSSTSGRRPEKGRSAKSWLLRAQRAASSPFFF